MISDLVVESGFLGPFDQQGNPFVAWHMRGNTARLFDEAIDRHDVKKVCLRHCSCADGEWRVRFTAYDKDGNCITDKVCN